MGACLRTPNDTSGTSAPKTETMTVSDLNGKSAPIQISATEKAVVHKVVELQKAWRRDSMAYFTKNQQYGATEQEIETARQAKIAAGKPLEAYIESDEFLAAQKSIDAKIQAANLYIPIGNQIIQIKKAIKAGESPTDLIKEKCPTSAHMTDYGQVYNQYDAAYINHGFHDHYYYQHPQQYLYESDNGYDMESLHLAIPAILIGLCLSAIIACSCFIIGGIITHGVTKLVKGGYKKVSQDRRILDQYDEVCIYSQNLWLYFFILTTNFCIFCIDK